MENLVMMSHPLLLSKVPPPYKQEQGLFKKMASLGRGM